MNFETHRDNREDNLLDLDDAADDLLTVEVEELDDPMPLKRHAQSVVEAPGIGEGLIGSSFPEIVEDVAEDRPSP